VCRWLSISRSTFNYQPKPLPERKQKLELEIVRISQEHPTLGYKKITRKLVELSYCANKKQVQRIRGEEGLQVPPPEAAAAAAGCFDGFAAAGGATESCVGLGLCERLHGAWRKAADVQPD